MQKVSLFNKTLAKDTLDSFFNETHAVILSVCHYPLIQITSNYSRNSIQTQRSPINLDHSRSVSKLFELIFVRLFPFISVIVEIIQLT